MFGLLFKITHKKHNENERNTRIQNLELLDTNAQQMQNLKQIDYDKLADAIVKANVEYKKIEKQKDEANFVKEREKWHKAIYGEDNNNSNGWKLFWGLMWFRKRDATDLNAIHCLLRLSNSCFLWLYKIMFLILGILGILFVLSSFYSFGENLKVLLLGNGSQDIFGIMGKQFILGLAVLFASILSILISNIIKIAKFESEKIENKKDILTIFNLITSFTAMLFGIVAVVVAIVI